MKRVSKVNNSGIFLKLADVMREKGINKNQMIVRTGLRYETIQGYYVDNITRVDLYVLAALCRALDCKVEDLLEFRETHSS